MLPPLLVLLVLSRPRPLLLSLLSRPRLLRGLLNFFLRAPGALLRLLLLSWLHRRRRRHSCLSRLRGNHLLARLAARAADEPALEFDAKTLKRDKARPLVAMLTG